MNVCKETCPIYNKICKPEECDEIKYYIEELKKQNKEMLNMLETVYVNVNNDLTDDYFLSNLRVLIEQVKND